MDQKKINADVYDVDEFRTSKICHNCFNSLANYNSTTKQVIESNSFSILKSCTHCNALASKILIIQRDINASLNIITKFIKKLKKETPILAFERGSKKI